MSIVPLALSLVIGVACGVVAGYRLRPALRHRVAIDVRRETTASFVAAVERWLTPLSGAPLTASDRRGVEIRRDEAHLAFARLELVVSERARLAARLWMDEAGAAYGVATASDVPAAAAMAAARPLVDRAWSHRHEFYVVARHELGAGSHLGLRDRVA